MTLRHWISFVFILIGLLGIQACGRKFNPEEACNFVQSGNLQRVSWKERIPVKLLIHTSVPTEAYGAIERAVESWNRDFGREILVIEAWGVGGSNSPVQDGHNIIYWMTSWETSRANEQARTTIYWHGNQIFEADLRLNAYNYSLFTGPGSNVSGVDLESLVLHELGHVLGLAHNDNLGSVMNISLSSGQTRRTLDAQDVESLRCEY